VRKRSSHIHSQAALQRLQLVHLPEVSHRQGYTGSREYLPLQCLLAVKAGKNFTASFNPRSRVKNSLADVNLNHL
jgi:hypothetical protein